MTDSHAAPGRRELNKARTREALIAALRQLAERQPLPGITVDQVAEEAGVSRRTFFNYFGSIPALLTEVFAGQAALIVAAADHQLLRVDPIAAMRALARADGIPRELLSWCAVLNRHEGSSDSVLIERAVWSDLAAWLEGVLTNLLPGGTDPLYVSTLASGVMSTFAAAEQTWLAGLTDGAELTDADLAAFDHHLDRALGYLATGWRPPH